MSAVSSPHPSAPDEEGLANGPERVGRYELLLPIGTGGMATVYLGRASGVGGFERDVALKVLHPHLVAQKAARSEFLEEAKLAASIRHPNCVPVIDVGEDPFGVFLVMEYVEGDSLAGLLGAATQGGDWLPSPVALRILLDALAGLHGAHELRDETGALAGLVHRDFSPQNILVGADGITRLTDFGIAKAKSRAGHTSPGLVKGKLRYMAPEQTQGAAFDRRCDVWAAGVVAWELWAGRRLYAEEDEVTILLSILSSDPPRLRDVDPEVPPAMDAAVARALVRDAKKRCGTADELRRLIVDAFPEKGRIAEATEVAAYVARLRGPALARRRAQAEEVRKARAAGHGGVEAASVASPDGATGAARAAETPPSAATEPIESTLGPKRRTGRGLGILAVVVLGLGAAAAAWQPWRGAEPSEPPARPASTDAPAAPALEAPAPVAAAPPSAAPDVDRVPEALDVHADAAIVQVRVGARVVAIAPASTAITLQLLPAERAVDRTLEVRAADGRRASSVVPAASSSVEVAFGPAHARAPRRPPPEAAATKRPPGPPPLPSSPYAPR